VLGPHGGAIERKQPTAFEDAIDDGRGEVVIMEDPPPGIERFVRGEDRRALFAMAIIDDVEEHVRRVGPAREIADLVADQYGGMGVRG
jgi:hypothetical protein